MTDMDIERIKLCGRFIGRDQLMAHLNGLRLTYKEMAKAKCFECMGGYSDGAQDCRIPACPLYRQMPYRGKKAVLCSPDPQKQGSPAMDGQENVPGITPTKSVPI